MGAPIGRSAAPPTFGLLRGCWGGPFTRRRELEALFRKLASLRAEDCHSGLGLQEHRELGASSPRRLQLNAVAEPIGLVVLLVVRRQASAVLVEHPDTEVLQGHVR